MDVTLRISSRKKTANWKTYWGNQCLFESKILSFVIDQESPRMTFRRLRTKALLWLRCFIVPKPENGDDCVLGTKLIVSKKYFL